MLQMTCRGWSQKELVGYLPFDYLLIDLCVIADALTFLDRETKAHSIKCPRKS